MTVDMVTSAWSQFFDWFMVRFDLIVLSASGFKNFGQPAIILAITVFLEIAARRDWRIRYGSHNFRIDVLYFLFFYSGAYHFFIFSWIYKAIMSLVTEYAPWLQMNLKGDMSPTMQIVTLIFVTDFVGYWSHRWKHSNRYVWAIHSIHHSQTKLTIMSSYRFHALDETLLRLWMFIPIAMLGSGIVVWLWSDFLMAWILALQHSEWNWTYGRLGRIFVSPVFHRQHHSTDERLQNKNFGMLFTFWDDMFGTAERHAPPPSRHGIAGDPVPESWLGQFVYPFLQIARELRRPALGTAPSVPPAGTPAE